MKKRLSLPVFTFFTILALVLGLAFPMVKASASGQGNCLDPNTSGWIKEDTGGTTVTINADSGDIITSVTVKAGSSHSSNNPCNTFTQDGTYECYSVSGLGTNSVTVTKVGSGPDCKDISHLEGIEGTPPPPETCLQTVDGTPSEWSDWTDNGDGTQTRTRTVPLLDANDNSISCGSRTETETEDIPYVTCSETVDGTPSEWSDWVDNGDGTETRTRTIPLLDAEDGSSCGSRTESQTQDIPYETCSQTVEGTPGEWSDWVDNGDGTETRTRTVPLLDANNGSSCGSRTEKQTQDIPPQVCAETIEGTPGPWSDWVDNGDGTQSRTRTIPLLDAKDNSINCGSRTETETTGKPPTDPCAEGQPGRATNKACKQKGPDLSCADVWYGVTHHGFTFDSWWRMFTKHCKFSRWNDDPWVNPRGPRGERDNN